jgi:2-methylisocitrate lyase-like PEP mutase family enzyme
VAGVEMARTLRVPFTFVARPENLIRGRLDLDDTIKRLQAFEKAGADVLYGLACAICRPCARSCRRSASL